MRDAIEHLRSLVELSEDPNVRTIVYTQPLAEYLSPLPSDHLDDTSIPAIVDPTPCRVQILLGAATLTNGDRDKEYGPPKVNLGAAGELKKTLRAVTTRQMSPGELEAWDMVLTKLARCATGSPKKDTYVDAAAYAAIAGEIALDEGDDA